MNDFAKEELIKRMLKAESGLNFYRAMYYITAGGLFLVYGIYLFGGL